MDNQRKSKTLQSKLTMSVTQIMYVHFFTNQGLAIQIAVPKGKSVNAKFYKGKVLHKFKICFKNQQLLSVVSGCCMTMLRHRTAIVLEYLKQEKVFDLLPLFIRQILPLVTFSYFQG
jgi:hypothetical protein